MSLIRHRTEPTAIAQVRDIETIVSGPGGRANVDAMEQIRSITASLREGPLVNPYVNEKLNTIDNAAAILFSAWRHERYPGGANGVRVSDLRGPFVGNGAEPLPLFGG